MKTRKRLGRAANGWSPVGWVEEGELRKVVTSEVLALRRGKRATSDCSPQSSTKPLFSLTSASLHKQESLTLTRVLQRLYGTTIYYLTLSLDSLYWRSAMELPPFSVEQLSTLAASNVPSSQLFEILSQYETDASIMSSSSGSVGTGGDDPKLLSLFYSSFFFAHLLTKQLFVPPYLP